MTLNTLELKVPPLAVVGLFGALMWLVSASSGFAIMLPWHSTLAILCCSVGLVIVLAGVVAFHRAKTTVNPLTPEAASTMVISGIYRFSRNPMYLGFVFILTGWAVYLSRLSAFTFLPLFVWYMNRFQILPEERALSAKFPREFTAYPSAVRRWL